MDDYAATAGPRRKEADRVHGTQPGDPDRAAQALLTAVAADVRPTFLALGSDAYAVVTSMLDARREQVEAWKDLTLSTVPPPGGGRPPPG